MIRFLKELYFTGYALGYKSGIAGGWGRLNPRFGVIMDQGKGVLLVSIILLLIFEGIKCHIEICVGKRFFWDNSPLELLAVLAIYYVNLHILVVRGHGIKFEREFNSLEKSRKVLLIMTFSGLALIGIAFSLYSRSAYFRSFH